MLEFALMGDKSVLITGSSGFVGSQCVRYFDRLGWRVHGIDNNMRLVFLGPGGDTAPLAKRLARSCRSFQAHHLDIRFRAGILDLVKELRPSLVIHCAAQSSSEMSKDLTFESFDINAGGTLNLIEACRRYCAESPFVFLSTNRVYGERPDKIALQELDSRWDYARPEDQDGIRETCGMDMSLHAIYGVSKAAADLLVQEYGRYFGLPTTCLRVSSVTGPTELGTENHGFLAYLAECFRERKPYRIYGHKGKQVRDTMHIEDLCEAIEQIRRAPQVGAVYNLGGGRSNSVSIREAIAAFANIFGCQLETQYVDEPRKGDYQCYISDTKKFREQYPEWSVRVSLAQIMNQCHMRVLAAAV